MRKLAVYMNDTEAGILTEQSPGFGYSYQYNEEYLKSALPPISVTLPKQRDPYSSDHLFAFFANMLPEGGNRRVICRHFRIDERDLFGLLDIMADQDFIGAVNVRKISDD